MHRAKTIVRAIGRWHFLSQTWIGSPQAGEGVVYVEPFTFFNFECAFTFFGEWKLKRPLNIKFSGLSLYFGVYLKAIFILAYYGVGIWRSRQIFLQRKSSISLCLGTEVTFCTDRLTKIE